MPEDLANPGRRQQRRERRQPVAEALHRAVDRFGLRGRAVLVAASGGLDSTTLVHGLGALSESCALKLSIGHINHGLRGPESEADERWIEALGEQLGLPVVCARTEIAELREAGPSRTRPTIQEAARTQRYEALERIRLRVGADCIVTAHTADDQAETLLLRLLRGCGPDALAGIAARSPDGRIVRPLLGVSRSDIAAHARREGITWREDSSNAHDDYTRNRLRHHTIPALVRDFNPRLLRTLGNLAETVTADRAWIDGLVEAESAHRLRVKDRAVEIVREGWAELPEALASRIVREALGRVGLGRELTHEHVTRVLAFTRGGEAGDGREPRRVQGRGLGLPCGWQLRRAQACWRIEKAPGEPDGEW